MVTRNELQRRARTTLDNRFAGWRQLPAGGARPHGGWVRAIRDALGMTAAELGQRMGVSQSVVTRMEQSERTGRVQLDTLQRAADALDCEVVYALVPRRNLDDMVTDRARALARHRLSRVGHTMALEDQLVDDTAMADKLELLTDQYRNTAGLWRTDTAIPRAQESTPGVHGASNRALG
ncbi:MAG: mobile mystery protein A [Nakamurella sp.]